jgi:hypothetical protein
MLGRVTPRERPQLEPAQAILSAPSASTALSASTREALGALSRSRHWTSPNCRLHKPGWADFDVLRETRRFQNPQARLYPLEPILRRAREWLLRAMKTHSKRKAERPRSVGLGKKCVRNSNVKSSYLARTARSWHFRQASAIRSESKHCRSNNFCHFRDRPLRRIKHSVK